MRYDTDSVVAAIEKAMLEMELNEERAHDIAFHMTDWLADFASLHEFFEAPQKYSPDEVSDLLMDFLVHAPNHIAAASKLMTGIPVQDIFEVGATNENETSL